MSYLNEDRDVLNFEGILKIFVSKCDYDLFEY